MKNLYKYCAVAALALTATSCANFLEEEPKGKLVAENFFKSSNDLTMAINALYNQVAVAQRNTNPYIIQLQGDDITINTTTKEAYLSTDAFIDPSDTKGADDLWSGRYSVIQAANLIVDNAEKAEASAEEINIALGNALYWRATSYFDLVRVFGPLPVNLHNLPDGNQTPMTGVEAIYDMIIADLERANALNLPASYENHKLGFTDKANYWCTRQCVKATLAAVYMNRGGYPFYEAGKIGKEWYKKAADLLNEVYKGVNEGTYSLSLEQDYGQVYSYGNNWSNEQLMTISFFDNPGMMGEAGTVNPTSQFSKCQTSAFQDGWIDFMGEYRWWSKFPEGPRKKAVYEEVVYTKYKDSVNGGICCIDWWSTKDEKEVNASRDNAQLNIYHPTFASLQVNADEANNPISAPYDCRKAVFTGQSVPQNHRYLRYSEVLCWFAEATGRAEATEYSADARAALQAVMDRAYEPGSAPVASGMSDSELAEQAWLEHGYEVTGYPLALVTRRADQFRLDRLKDAWAYRNGPQNDVLVPEGTSTIAYKVQGRLQYTEYTYPLSYDLKRAEDNQVASEWRGYQSMYYPYPPKEIIKNPNIKRVSAMN